MKPDTSLKKPRCYKKKSFHRNSFPPSPKASVGLLKTEHKRRLNCFILKERLFLAQPFELCSSTVPGSFVSNPERAEWCTGTTAEHSSVTIRDAFAITANERASERSNDSGCHAWATNIKNEHNETTFDKVILMENVKPLSTSMYKACVTLALLTN